MSKTISWSLRILKIKKGVTFDNLSYFFLNANLTRIKVHKCELYYESISIFFFILVNSISFEICEEIFFFKSYNQIKITAIED